MHTISSISDPSIVYKQVTGAHLKPCLTPPMSPLKKPASITPKDCLSKQINQVDLPGIASSSILYVQESGYKSEEEPRSIKLCVKSKDSIFSDQCSSQIPQQHTSTQQSYGSTGIASTNGEQEAEYKSKENKLFLQQYCKSEESVA